MCTLPTFAMVATLGHAGVRQACTFGPETFDSLLGYHELGHLIPETA